jgi:hypothetical protein
MPVPAKSLEASKGKPGGKTGLRDLLRLKEVNTMKVFTIVRIVLAFAGTYGSSSVYPTLIP